MENQWNLGKNELVPCSQNPYLLSSSFTRVRGTPTPVMVMPFKQEN